MCDCIKTVDEKLLAGEKNVRIVTPWLVMEEDKPPRTLVVVEKIDKSIRKKAQVLFASFCPFCGEKY